MTITLASLPVPTGDHPYAHPYFTLFIDRLDVHLSKPQRLHILRMADALLVCEDARTPASLQRQFVEAPDASNMADCLRISPWRADTFRPYQVKWLIAEAERRNAPGVIYIDDSLGEKDPQTRHLEPVDWFFDHTDHTCQPLLRILYAEGLGPRASARGHILGARESR